MPSSDLVFRIRERQALGRTGRPLKYVEMGPGGFADAGYRNGTQAGEVVRCRHLISGEPNETINDWYGFRSLVEPEFAIIRVMDLLDDEARMLCARDVLRSEDAGRGFEARARLWRCRLTDFPSEWKDKLSPRKLPDVDAPWFNANPVFRNRLLTRYPFLADLPQIQRRPAPFDLALSHDEIMPFFYIKAPEPRDPFDSIPVDDGEPSQEI